MYSICTLQKRTNTVQILYIYCTYARVGSSFFLWQKRFFQAQKNGGNLTEKKINTRPVIFWTDETITIKTQFAVYVALPGRNTTHKR
jgi:hypothetical protein